MGSLRQAFQLAGAQDVVASLWKVPDDTTATLLSDFFAELESGAGAAEALRRAMLRQVDGHPFEWAALVLTAGR